MAPQSKSSSSLQGIFPSNGRRSLTTSSLLPLLLCTSFILSLLPSSTQGFSLEASSHKFHSPSTGSSSNRILITYPVDVLPRRNPQHAFRRRHHGHYHDQFIKTTALEMAVEDSSSSSSSNSVLDRPVLAGLDLVALLVFAGIGRASHASDGSIDVFATVQTAFPFVVAWFLSSFFTGVYDDPINAADDATGSNTNYNNVVLDSWKQTAKGWVVAVPLGCVGRGLIKGYVPPAPFVIVTMVATLVILGTTRMVYNIVAASTRSQDDNNASI